MKKIINKIRNAERYLIITSSEDNIGFESKGYASDLLGLLEFTKISIKENVKENIKKEKND